MLRVLGRVYDLVVIGMAWAAGVWLLLVFVAIVVDVCIRTGGGQPPEWTSTLVEYAMLYVCMLGGPWVTRCNAHVAIESLTQLLPRPLRKWIERGSIVLCLAGASIISIYSVSMTLDAFRTHEVDIRSIEVPAWLLLAVIPLGFAMVGIEFARLLMRGGSFEAGRDHVRDTV